MRFWIASYQEESFRKCSLVVNLFLGLIFHETYFSKNLFRPNGSIRKVFLKENKPNKIFVDDIFCTVEINSGLWVSSFIKFLTNWAQFRHLTRIEKSALLSILFHLVFSWLYSNITGTSLSNPKTKMLAKRCCDNFETIVKQCWYFHDCFVSRGRTSPMKISDREAT